MKTNVRSTNSKTQSAVAKGLNRFLADSYTLMGVTHHAHWNVEGPSFFALHQAFEVQYTDLFTAVDEIAERVRALGAYALGGLTALAKDSGIVEFPTGPIAAEDYVKGLISAHEKTLADAIAVRDAAEKAKDLETQDLVIGRITWHEKTIWMLKSFLKGS